ncbi:BamA/TamA family outer membrane protein [Chitinophaga sp. GCM10012297]|uniref:BamA/TamA family outer membrane protein n=1 Tax=Chitinophaga chungangae TaxID=2821488 RepID=A0ABS3YI47_9BACT|nr:BamA/TamA family outer membrane protein [Chitinophaga chungangae]MBO9154105.1 BamA/TamA family outer membrane protein [Chitinophaga chungangae]
MTRNLRYISLSALALLLAACSTTRTVPEGDRLYTGHEIKWTEKKKPKDWSDLKSGMDERVRPSPNRKFLGMPIKLWLYNLGNEPKGKGLNHLLRNKWGEAPVLMSQVRPNRTERILNSYLEDNGYFQSEVESEVKNKGSKKASLVISAEPGHRYTIHRVRFDTDTGVISREIILNAKHTLLKPDDNYSLDMIKAERERIHNHLKEEGFYYFTPDYMLIQVDSTLKGQVDLYVKLKNTAPATALRQYWMQSVEVYPNYDLTRDSALKAMEGRQYQNFTIIDPDSLFKPIVFDRSVFLQRDSIYRLSSHNITLQRLVNLGTFKFVRGSFRPIRDSSLLAARFYLTPYPKRSLQFEVSGTSKSNGFVGSQVKISARNRNFQRKANVLEINLGGGFETQVGGKTTNLSTNAYSFNTEVALTLPRFYTPLIYFNPRTPYVPRTRFSIGYELLNRPAMYNLNAFTLQYGYIWKQTKFLDHMLYPVAITYALPGNISPEFQVQLEQDPALKQSISKQFILGSNYTLTFNNQSPARYHSFYASFNGDIAGNLAGLIAKKQDDGSKTVFKQDFSQYLRGSVDGRHYWKLGDNLRWVNRLFAGYGYAYGKSVADPTVPVTLPFVKQFFSGGSNSIRAFRARTLGPGSYHESEQPGTNLLLANAAGDIKLEFNSELRFKPQKLIELAAFVDAGNIWLGKSDSTKKVFAFDRFYKEIAVGTGIGLRIDASILLIRFDISFPLRKPWYDEGNRWVFDEINFGDKAWRKENLILNIAIGYPF